MKKVLFIIPTLAHGGAEKVLVNLVNNMDQNKYDISIKTIFDFGVNKEFLKPHISYSYMFEKIFRGFSATMRFFKAEWLYKHFIGEEYDIVISYLEGITAKIAAGSSGKKISWIHIEMLDEKSFRGGFRSKEEALRIYNSFDYNICVSEVVKERFCSFGIDKLRTKVLYNTNETNEIIEKAEESIEDVHFEENVINMISVGKLVPAKGYDRLLRIHNHLIKEGFAIHTYILGIGEHEKEYRKFIKEYGLEDSFTLLGYRINPYKYVKKCDLYVCSSRREGFSTSVTEALIVGTPVISTNCSGAYELLGIENEYGVVTKNEEDDLEIQLRALLQDKNKLAYYQKQAVKRGSFFEKEKTVQKVEELFESLYE